MSTLDFHVITAQEQKLVMQTAAGHVVKVLPAPPSSLPADGAPAPQVLGAASGAGPAQV